MDLVPLEKLNELIFRSEPQPAAVLQKWCRTRRLPARKLGGKWYVDLDALRNPPAPAPRPAQDPDALARAILEGIRRGEAH